MTCPEEDIELFARGFYGRHRERAHSMAMERAAELGSESDVEGIAVWRRVADQIQRLETNDALQSGNGSAEQVFTETGNAS